MKSFGVVVILLFAALTSAQAQDCRRCSMEATVAACVPCSVAAGYPQATSEKWCRKNQPLCGGAKQKSR